MKRKTYCRLGESIDADYGEEIIVVDRDYVVNSQGVILSFYVTTDYTEVNQITELANMLIEFIQEEYGDLIEEFYFEAKYPTPILYSDNCSSLKMVMCLATEPSERLFSSLRNLGIEQTEYL